jgi:hypothetical protein
MLSLKLYKISRTRFISNGAALVGDVRDFFCKTEEVNLQSEGQVVVHPLY